MRLSAACSLVCWACCCAARSSEGWVQLLAELRQTLIALQEPFFHQPDLAGTINASTAAEHPAKNAAGNQPGEHAESYFNLDIYARDLRSDDVVEKPNNWVRAIHRRSRASKAGMMKKQQL